MTEKEGVLSGPHGEVATRGCTCSGNSKWSAWVSTKGVFVWGVFFVGGRGTQEWLMRFRECPDPEGFPTYMISLKEMLRSRACFHSSSGTCESSPKTLIITPKVCYVQKPTCHCSNVLAGSVYSMQTSLLRCSFNAAVVTQKPAQGDRLLSPELHAGLSDKVTR